MKIGDQVTFYSENGYRAQGIIWDILGDYCHIKVEGGYMMEIKKSDIIN